MIDRSRITGLVLAGGRGTRMGSVDKGLEAFDGRPLVAHALERLAASVGPLVISANRHRGQYQALGLGCGAIVVEDRFADYAGPLAGLHAGLVACTTEYLVAVPCDAPFFPLDLVACLGTAFAADASADGQGVVIPAKAGTRSGSGTLGPGLRRGDMNSEDAPIDVAVACTPVRTHPVFCMMRRDVAPALARHIEDGGRRMQGWLATMRVGPVSFADESAFRNLNTLDELLTAERSR